MMIRSKKHILSSIVAVCLMAVPCHGAKKQSKAEAAIQKKVEATLAKMKLEEKMDLLGEYKGGFSTCPIPRLGIPEVKMADASMGVRNYGKSTQYPASVVVASTWNRRMMAALSTSLATDCKARGVGILLGPGVNIMRSPVCGRNFEYYSEDPYLTAQMAVPFIKGLQQNGVAAVVKHFALNNMEWGRKRIDSRADERTCHEIYFPAFRAAVVDAEVAGVMDAYNLVNGVYATENSWLNTKVLRGMWGFNGVVMSDWGATHSTGRAMRGGLDLDMDGKDRAKYFNRDSLKTVMANEGFTMKELDDKVRHILHMIYSFEFDKLKATTDAAMLDNKNNGMVAQKLAEEGIVLLKNQGSLLPIPKAKSVMVVGPFADEIPCGGGSSKVTPFSTTSITGGLKVLMKSVDIKGHQIYDEEPCTHLYRDRGGRTPGLKAEYFNNPSLGGIPLMSDYVDGLNFYWGAGTPQPDFLGTDNFSIRYTGYLRVPASGEYTLVLSSDDASRMWIDDAMVLDNWGDHSFSGNELTINLQANRDYAIRIDYTESEGEAGIRLGYRIAQVDNLATEAALCDAVIVTAGFGEKVEKEGTDRPWQLPAEQVKMIKDAAASNANVVVVLFTGGAVDVSTWANDVRSIIWAGYPGQGGGQALANIITGKVTPSGKLTATWAQQWYDYASSNNFYEKAGEDFINYDERLFVGYRSFDKDCVAPAFPFGFGMSYTRFAYSNLKVKRTDKQCQVKVDVQNTGKMAGAEVVQVYVEPLNVGENEPVQTLRGFEKIFLKPGEKKTVTMMLDANAFATYKVTKKAFTVDPGQYKIKVGASSRDIRQSFVVKVEKATKVATD
ncbi:MAG: glycoside hydrolase family 3 C-terminal domain-containing protein [Bacteroidales bacterium]|nr:glycoside hydrolase family 3 C-terminal domain-containing protein [Bacteroidales bacterium]